MPDYLLDYMTKSMSRVVGTDARVYGLFWHPAEECRTAKNKGSQYADAIKRSSGTYGSICADDYTATLQKISADISTILKSQFALVSVPDAGSAVVKVNDVEMSSGWSVSGSTLTFAAAPASGARVSVSYTTGARAVVKKFHLDNAPAAATVRVTVNGQAAAANTFAFDEAANDVVFAAAPANNANIKVDYRQVLPALKTEFALGRTIKSETLAVKVNDVAAPAVSLSGQSLVFAAAPADAADISVKGAALVGPRLDYALSLSGVPFGQISVVDGVSGDVVKAAVGDGKLVLEPSEFRAGRKLLVRYRNGEASALPRFALPEVPLVGSIKIEGNTLACEAAGAMAVNGKVVSFACPFLSDAAAKVSYSYMAAPLRIFPMPDVLKPDDGTWQVFVNGKETQAFTRNNFLIQMQDELAPDAVVKVIFLSNKA